MKIHNDFYQIADNYLVEIAFVLAWETEYKDLLIVKQILALPQLRTRIEFAIERNQLKHEVLEKLSVFVRLSEPTMLVGAIAVVLNEIKHFLKNLLEIGLLTVYYAFIRLSEPKTSASSLQLILYEIEHFLKVVLKIGFLAVGSIGTDLEMIVSLHTQAAQKLLPLPALQPFQEVAKPNSKPKPRSRNTTRKKKTV